MSQSLQYEIKVPNDQAMFQAPPNVQHRFRELSDNYYGRHTFDNDEKLEAERLVNVAEFLPSLRLRGEYSSIHPV